MPLVSELGTARARPARNYWTEIDLMRGMAGALMVTNHAGVHWLPESMQGSGPSAVAVFIGGLAPVFFFTVTGIGRGIQSGVAKKPKPFRSTLWKALVLLLADVALWLTPHRHWGLDFMLFIGLSIVVVELVHRTPRPMLTAALGLLTSVGLRFAVAPLLTRLGIPHESAVSRFVLGDVRIEGVSYLLCPWLAYPLLGSMLGTLAARHADRLRAARLRTGLLVGGLGLLGLLVCGLLKARGFVFFRWGTMSLAYFVFGVSAIAVGAALALLLVHGLRDRVLRWLVLPGVASFVLVPIHYTLITLLAPFLRWPSSVLFLPAIALFLPVVFVLSRATERAFASLASRPIASALPLAVTLVLLAGLLWIESPLVRIPVAAAAQLTACLLLVFASRATTSTGSRGAPAFAPRGEAAS